MEATDNPYAAVAAGLVGGIAGGAPIAAAQVGKRAIRPLTQGGREKIVSGLMREQFTNPAATDQALQNVPTYVPRLLAFLDNAIPSKDALDLSGDALHNARARHSARCPAGTGGRCGAVLRRARRAEAGLTPADFK